MQPPIIKIAIREMKIIRRKETCAFFPSIEEREVRALRFLFVARFPKFM